MLILAQQPLHLFDNHHKSFIDAFLPQIIRGPVVTIRRSGQGTPPQPSSKSHPADHSGRPDINVLLDVAHNIFQLINQLTPHADSANVGTCTFAP